MDSGLQDNFQTSYERDPDLASSIDRTLIHFLLGFEFGFGSYHWQVVSSSSYDKRIRIQALNLNHIPNADCFYFQLKCFPLVWEFDRYFLLKTENSYCHSLLDRSRCAVWSHVHISNRIVWSMGVHGPGRYPRGSWGSQIQDPLIVELTPKWWKCTHFESTLCPRAVTRSVHGPGR